MQNSPGTTSITSPFSIDESLAKLKAFIASKGLTLFAHIDHSAGARDVGLTMQLAHVLIFGHAKAGTPLMVASPLLALDLPLKVLVWEDHEQKVWVSFNTVEYLAQRHSIPPELIKNISGVPDLIKGALKND